VLAEIILIEIVLLYYWNICLKTSAYNWYQQQLQMNTQSVFTPYWTHGLVSLLYMWCLSWKLLWKYRNKTMWKAKFTFSQGIECGIVRSNFSPFNLNILLLSVPKMKYVKGEWRKLLHNLYSSPGHVARMGQGENCTKFWWEAWRKETTQKTKA
jgi:hypothetical protein